MLFHEKLALIKEIISVTGTALAREAGLAPSCVCRYLSAKNSPFRGGGAVTRLSRAAAALAPGGRELNALREAAEARADEKTADAVERWLNAPDSGLREKKPQEAHAPAARVGIAAKLALLMDSFGTSNAELARYANLDGSSVSRYRSGKRSVRSDDPILRSFCSYFAVLCKSRGVPEALAGELNASDGGCGECEALAARLLEWICEDSAKRPWLSRGLLEGADSAAPSAREAAPAAEGGVETGGRVYSGAEGLLAAVGEFARAAGCDGRPRDVYVYTSYLSWFSREPRFAGACAELMRGMMERGHKITSVHNIGFDADEIFEMIETWLPLFLTGKVEARYLTRPNRSLFSEFMGAAGNCSVRFSTLRGGSVRTRAFFSESGEEAAFVREQVEGLAAYSKPLVAFFRKEDTERLYSDAENCRGADGDVIKLTRRPTMESMPENLAERIFARVAPSRECFELLKRRYETRRAVFLDSLSHVGVTEIFPQLTQREIDSGEAQLALPWEAGFSASYTPDEYAAHMAALDRLAFERANYRVLRRASMPFSTIDLIVKEGSAVYVAKNDGEPAAVSFLNSQVCYLLERYVKKFVKN